MTCLRSTGGHAFFLEVSRFVGGRSSEEGQTKAPHSRSLVDAVGTIGFVLLLDFFRAEYIWRVAAYQAYTCVDLPVSAQLGSCHEAAAYSEYGVRSSTQRSRNVGLGRNERANTALLGRSPAANEIVCAPKNRYVPYMMKVPYGFQFCFVS